MENLATKITKYSRIALDKILICEKYIAVPENSSKITISRINSDEYANKGGWRLESRTVV